MQKRTYSLIGFSYAPSYPYSIAVAAVSPRSIHPLPYCQAYGALVRPSQSLSSDRVETITGVVEAPTMRRADNRSALR